MCTFEEFLTYTSFKDFLNAGEDLNENNINEIPEHYYSGIRVFFEENTTINKIYKVKKMKIIFKDNDVVFYLFKYNQIMNNKIYRLTNIPFSLKNNKFHIISVLKALFEVMPYTTIIISNLDINKYNMNNYKFKFLPGYENYYYEYDDLIKKINSHNSSKYEYKKFQKHAICKYYDEMTIELKTEMYNIFNIWFKNHPNPNRTTKSRFEEVLLKPCKTFLIEYDKKNICCIIGGFNINNITQEKYYYSTFTYDFSRIGYHNCTLYSNMSVLKFLNENFNITKYYVGGYSPKNKGLKMYKENWSTDKISYYTITKEYLDFFIKNAILQNEEQELILF